MIKSLLQLVVLTLLTYSGVAQNSDDDIEYIKSYYSDFKTGYDFDSEYVAISENYKATFADTIFTLTFDTFDENKEIQKQTITINPKGVFSIEPNGTDVVEIFGNDPLIVPICGKLAFITAHQTFNINIYYEVDADVEQSEIYFAFNQLIETNKN